MITHYGSFELGTAPFDGTLRVDVNTTCSLIESVCAGLPSPLGLASVEGIGERREWASIEELRGSLNDAYGIGAFLQIDGAQLNLTVGPNNVFVHVVQGDQRHDSPFLGVMDSFATQVDLTGVDVAIGEGSGGQTQAGFWPPRKTGGLKYFAHSPVMYFTSEVFELLDLAAMADTTAVRDLGGDGQQSVKRVQFSPIRSYDVEARNTAFNLIAPIRPPRMPVRYSPSALVRWDLLSSIEAVLIATTPELPRWHPDWGVATGDRTYKEWEASYTDNLRLTPQVYERAMSFEFPSMS